MCKHILNCQTYISSPCCGRWFECAECHDEMVTDHTFKFSVEIAFTCKVCRKTFKRDFRLFSESDKHCNFCQTRWCLPATTPESAVYNESCDVANINLLNLIDSSQQYFNYVEPEVDKYAVSKENSAVVIDSTNNKN